MRDTTPTVLGRMFLTENGLTEKEVKGLISKGEQNHIRKAVS